MITELKSDKTLKFVGLSTDTKPENDPNQSFIENGSLFLEMDTKKIFIFDEQNDIWLEWK